MARAVFARIAPVAVLAAAFLAMGARDAPQRAGGDVLADLPLTMVDGHYVLQARVNGAGPFDFIVDTAATSTLLQPHVAAEAGLEAPTGTVMVHGLHASRWMPAHNVAELAVGDLVKRELSVVVPPAGDDPAGDEAEGWIDGVLGTDVIGELSIELDLAGGRVRVREGPFRPSRRTMATRVYFERGAGGLPFVRARVNGSHATALIDTGLPNTIVNTTLANRARVPQRAIDLDTMVDATAESVRVSVWGAGDVRVGRIRWGRSVFVVYDAPVFERFGLSRRPAMIIGADLLAEHQVVVDYAANQLILVRPKRRARS